MQFVLDPNIVMLGMTVIAFKLIHDIVLKMFQAPISLNYCQILSDLVSLTHTLGQSSMMGSTLAVISCKMGLALVVTMWALLVGSAPNLCDCVTLVKPPLGAQFPHL